MLGRRILDKKQHRASLLITFVIFILAMAHLDPCSALSLPEMPSVLIGKADDKPLQQHMLLAPTIAGGIATAVGDLALHPIDTIKTVQQS